MSIRAGDAVHHAPSGETWLAATDEDANGMLAALLGASLMLWSPIIALIWYLL